MARRAIRRARQLRDAWVAGLTSRPTTDPIVDQRLPGRGADYRDASPQWACNRKKAYPSEDIARQVAARMNDTNASEETARPGYFGVIVNPYSCGRCGAWHLGR